MSRTIKVISGFSIVLVLIISAIWFAGREHMRLKNELRSIYTSDDKFELLGAISTQLGQYEKYVAQYLNSLKKKDMKAIRQVSDSINIHITTLKKISENTSYQPYADTIEILFRDFSSLTQDLVALKQQKDTTIEERIMAMVSQTGDSILNDSSVLNLIHNKYTATLIEKPVYIKVEPTKTSNRKKKKQEEEILDSLMKANSEPTVTEVYEAETFSTDSILLAKIDSLFTQMNEELLVIKMQSEEYRKKVLIRETYLAMKREEVFDKMNTLVAQVRKDEQAKLDAGIDSAYNKSENAMQALFWLLAVASVLGIIFVISLVFDISRSHYYQQQLKKEKQKAETLADARAGFLSHMSHEVRTPLNAILGFTKLLEDSSANSQRQDYISRIKGAGGHLLALVNNVLNFSRLKSGHLKPAPVSFSPQEAAEEVYEVMDVLAVSKELYLEMEIDPSIPHVRGDVLWFKQILYNLVGNAIKYTESGRVKIRLSAKTMQGNLCMLRGEISDTGPGIPAHLREKIFVPFEAADSMQGVVQSGTGLGLSITHDMICLQGGEIRLADREQTGTTFIFDIPYTVAEDTGKAAEIQRLSGKCLVVDDDYASRMLIAEFLSAQGMNVLQAASAEAGYQVLLEEEVDIVICDEHLGKMKGTDMIARFYRWNGLSSRTHFVISSAELIQREELPEAWKVSVLPKPLQPDTLLAHISSIFVQYA